MGFVFQAYNLIPSLTARENVALITEICRDPMAPEEALAMVDLADRLDHFPAQLSGGEQQRVAIARALMNDPLFLLADEATGNLDSNTEREILDLMDELRQEGVTIVIVTHNPKVAERADRVLWLKDGVVEFDKAHRKVNVV